MNGRLLFALVLVVFLSALPARAGDGYSGGALRIGPAEDESEGGNLKVEVVVDMTDAGRQMTRPTRGKPVYYLPVQMGYKELGYAPYFQRTPPAPSEVKNLLERELSSQGYLVMTREHEPSLVLSYHWGYIDPGPSYDLGLDNMPMVNMTWVLWGTQGSPITNSHNHLMDGSDDYRVGHWYLLIYAWDFNAWMHHKVALAWCAHITTNLWGHYFDQVLPTLISTAGPMLGRATTEPNYINVPVEPEGRVIVGTPEVAGFPPGPTLEKKP